MDVTRAGGTRAGVTREGGAAGDLPGLAAQWVGLLGAPAVFFAHLQLAYVEVYRACRYHTDVWTHVIGVGSVLLAAACTAVAWHVWDRTRHDAPEEGGGPAARARFLGATGLGVGALLVLLLTADWAAAFFIAPCQ